MDKFDKKKVVNPHAAGIDVGSKSHFVALGQELEDVREFGVYSEDHEQMIEFLHTYMVAYDYF